MSKVSLEQAECILKKYINSDIVLKKDFFNKYGITSTKRIEIVATVKEKNPKLHAKYVNAKKPKVLQDEELMKAALTDKLHQPYRAKLVPWMDEINQSIKHDDDIFGCVLSGAGSTVLVISKQNATDRVRNKISEVMTNLNVKADIKTLKVENDGATIVS